MLSLYPDESIALRHHSHINRFADLFRLSGHALFKRLDRDEDSAL